MVLIRNHKNLRYLHPNGEWTDDLHAARAFRGSALALAFIQKHRLCDVRVVLTPPQRAGTDALVGGEPRGETPAFLRGHGE